MLMTTTKLFHILILFTALLFVACAQNCSNQPLTSSNGRINFSPLSDDSGPVDASYNPSLVSRTWFSLANGFVDIVRPGGLPYDLILPVINSSFVQSSSDLSNGFDPLSFLQNFAIWWAGILVVTLLGILLGVSCCACGCCYWCCRCCGNCGAGEYQKHSKNNDCIMFTYSMILLLITLILLAAAVLSFFSNEQTFQVLNNLQVTLNSVSDDTVNYVTDTIDEILQLVCNLFSNAGVLNLISRESMNDVEQNLLPEAVENILMQLQQTGNMISSTQEIRSLTNNITTVGNSLVNTTCVYQTSLQNITDFVSRLGSTCDNVPACAMALCALRNSTNKIPDVMGVLRFVTDVNGAVGNIDGQNRDELLKVLLPQVQLIPSLAEIDNIPLISLNSTKRIRTLIVDEILNNSFPAENCPRLDTFEAFSGVVLPTLSSSGGTSRSNPTTLSLGYVRQCIINASFDYIRMFDSYRYGFGIVVCSLSLVVIGLMWTGLVCGFVGFRKGRLPSERSSLSNCGGIFLLIGVGVTFLFGFFLLLLSAIFFFFGSNSLKICQAFQGPNYEIFSQAFDLPEVRNSLRIPADIPSISGFLRGCEENNTALFTALNLSNPLLLTNSAENAASLQAAVNMTVENARMNFNGANLSRFVSDGIERLQNINVTTYNITNIFEQINSSISIVNAINTTALRDLAGDGAATNDLIMKFENIRANASTLLESISMLINLSQELEDIRGNLMASMANEIAEQIEILSQPFLSDFFNETLNYTLARSSRYLEQYFDHLQEQIAVNVGGCQPVYGVYTQMHNVICRDFIDGLNGFWFSLGLCGVLFIPLIIFATLTASYFREKQTRGGQNSGIDDIPMKTI